MLQSADELFRRLGEKSLAGNSWNDHLPKPDYEHMLYTLPKILGFTLWKKTQISGAVSQQEKTELYFQAYTTTQYCFKAENIEKKKLLDVYNNLLYYCVGFAFTAATDDPRLDAIKTEIPTLLDKLIDGKGGIDQMSIEDLDTVFRAYAWLNDPKAKELATILIQRCLRRDAGLVTSLRLSIAEVAQEYLDKGTIVAM